MPKNCKVLHSFVDTLVEVDLYGLHTAETLRAVRHHWKPSFDERP